MSIFSNFCLALGFRCIIFLHLKTKQHESLLLTCFLLSFTGFESTECFQLVYMMIFLNHFEMSRWGHESEQLHNSRFFFKQNDVQRSLNSSHSKLPLRVANAGKVCETYMWLASRFSSAFLEVKKAEEVGGESLVKMCWIEVLNLP